MPHNATKFRTLELKFVTRACQVTANENLYIIETFTSYWCWLVCVGLKMIVWGGHWISRSLSRVQMFTLLTCVMENNASTCGKWKLKHCISRLQAVKVEPVAQHLEKLSFYWLNDQLTKQRAIHSGQLFTLWLCSSHEQNGIWLHRTPLSGNASP